MNVMMNLSFKDTKFIIEALTHLQTAYNKRLFEIEDKEEYEDEASELGNDLLFLESLFTELELMCHSLSKLFLLYVHTANKNLVKSV